MPHWLLNFMHLISIVLSYEKSIEEFAADTYKAVIPCIELGGRVSRVDLENWKFPEDAEQHFQILKNKTAEYRKIEVNSYCGFDGPWLENIVISEYLEKPLSFFGGFIPLFVQWVDIQVLMNGQLEKMQKSLELLLRPNVLYLAISQSDRGILDLGSAFPNIFVLSCGGFGHVPLPLVKGNLDWRPQPAQYEQDFGFYGTVRPPRSPMLKIVKKICNETNHRYKQSNKSNWVEEMAATKFNLAPRGYGRTSFRFSE